MGLGICIVRNYTGSSGPANGLLTGAALEGRNEGRNEAKSEAINEAVNGAVNGAVNDTVKSPATLFHHFTASWRNNCRIKCRIKCRCKDIASRCCLRIVFLLSGESKNDNRSEYRKTLSCLCFLRSPIYRVHLSIDAKIPLAVSSKRDLRLDINLAGQILPLIAAEDLSVGLAILLCFLVIDGKFEVQLMPPQF